MRVLITGATGTIGRAVARALQERGDQVVAVSRTPDRCRTVLGAGSEVHAWSDPASTPPPVQALRVDGIVNLIGEPIDQRWTDDAKQRIRGSRVHSTHQLVAGITALGEAERPGVLVSQSAVGIYGDRGDETLTERAVTANDWLATVVTDWELQAHQAPPPTRVVTTRTGVVLSPSGGALAKMLPFFKLGIGGPVAGGRQYVPWIHLADVVGALLYCLDTEAVSGAVNLSAPQPVTNAALSTALGHALHRPAVLPVPGFALGLLYGEMAQLVTGGQRAVPARLTELGYTFTQPQLDAALRDVVR